MPNFWVADLTPTGDVRELSEYDYATLEQIPLALDLITEFSTYLWRSPEEFETHLPLHADLTLRWRTTAESSGVSTLRCSGRVLSVSVLVSGKDPESDSTTLEALQAQILHELHDTGYEPSFAITQLKRRPLVATVNLSAPPDPADHEAFALADRCFAASYFRRLGLA